MKKFDRLAIYGWPALAIIFFFSLFTGLLLIPNIKQVKTGPLPKASVVRYAVADNRELLSLEETAEIRALYASDLFSSSRNSRHFALRDATNRFNQTNKTSSSSPLFLPFTPVSKETNLQLSAINAPDNGHDACDLPFIRHQPKQNIQTKTGRPIFSIELKGGLKSFKVEQNLMQGIPAPPDKRARFFQAEIRVNSQGQVDRVFAESTDYKPIIYREIVKRLYHARFDNAARACEGTVIISYPAYSQVNSNNQVNTRQ